MDQFSIFSELPPEIQVSIVNKLLESEYGPTQTQLGPIKKLRRLGLASKNLPASEEARFLLEKRKKELLGACKVFDSQECYDLLENEVKKPIDKLNPEIIQLLCALNLADPTSSTPEYSLDMISTQIIKGSFDTALILLNTCRNKIAAYNRADDILQTLVLSNELIVNNPEMAKKLFDAFFSIFHTREDLPNSNENVLIQIARRYAGNFPSFVINYLDPELITRNWGLSDIAAPGSNETVLKVLEREAQISATIRRNSIIDYINHLAYIEENIENFLG